MQLQQSAACADGAGSNALCHLTLPQYSGVSGAQRHGNLERRLLPSSLRGRQQSCFRDALLSQAWAGGAEITFSR